MATDQLRVLFVDGDKTFVKTMAREFRAAGFGVTSAARSAEALDLLASEEPDVLVTERTVDEVSGIELCRRLRAARETRSLPIIMTATASDHVDLARALDFGVDDFVHKPVTTIELLARARALLRRVRPSKIGERLEWQDISVETETLRAYRGDTLLRIGPTEFRLLATFVERPGRVWTREQLLDVVWGRSTYVDTRTVDVHVGRLRKTLREAGDGDPFRTIRGTGYALG
jgi:two-component system, OmpR family, phosphate regulon response regulator PhoB